MNEAYVPFLKLKVNEVAALKVIEDKYKEFVTPFFDLPRKKDMDEESFVKMINVAQRKIETHLQYISYFYIDDYDVDDSITVSGEESYQYVLNEFSSLPFVPVVALDREDERIDAVIDGKKSGLIASSRIAIRLQIDDFNNFSLTESDLVDLVERCDDCFKYIDIIFDCRVCIPYEVNNLTDSILLFINGLDAAGIDLFDKYIVAGSSIPASIGEIVPVKVETSVLRKELLVFKGVHEQKTTDINIVMGDYGIVSPNYSELDIIPEAMRNITAPKILYSYDDYFYVSRGAGLKTHPKGNLQYNDMCGELVSHSFYRGKLFSFGDNYLLEKAGNLEGVTPSSILKPTINAHITYMLSAPLT